MDDGAADLAYALARDQSRSALMRLYKHTYVQLKNPDTHKNELLVLLPGKFISKTLSCCYIH